MLLGDVLLAE